MKSQPGNFHLWRFCDLGPHFRTCCPIHIGTWFVSETLFYNKKGMWKPKNTYLVESTDLLVSAIKLIIKILERLARLLAAICSFYKPLDEKQRKCECLKPFCPLIKKKLQATHTWKFLTLPNADAPMNIF